MQVIKGLESVAMDIERKELIEIIQIVVDNTIKGLVDKGLVGNVGNVGNASGSASPKKTPMKEKSAYAQTEALLFNYNTFKKIIREKQQEIDDIRKYGVLERGGAVKKYGGNCGGLPRGIVLDDERVEDAVRNVEKSMESTVQAVALIEKTMATMKNDPYYKILEMRYFEGRTQEDIAAAFKCTQPNVTYHKSRLVKELSIKLFPDKVVNEYLK